MKKTISYLFASVGIATALTLASCSKDNKLPAIDGYDNSDAVSSSHLVAHWTFDGTTKEAISGTDKNGGYGTTGFTTGVLGQAISFNTSAIVYPELSAFSDANSLNNFTVSMWVKVAGTKDTGGAFSAFFSLAPESVSDIWPDVFLGAETSRHPSTSDTLEIKGLLNTHPAAGKDQEDNIAQLNPNSPNDDPDAGKGAWFKRPVDSWVHFVLSWNASTHQFVVYGNSANVGGWPTKTNPGNEILAVPVRAIFGSLPSSDLGFTSAPATQSWAPGLIGSIDDVRIYNTALSQTEVTALYDLGLAGR